MPRKLIYLLTLLLCISSANAKILLWDLGGVLFDKNEFGFARSIGLFSFLSYGLIDQRGWSPKPVLYEMLNTFGMQSETASQPFITDPDGLPLPAIMCDWLTGKITPERLRNSISQRINDLSFSNFFVSRREQELVAKTAQAIFDPATFIRNTKPIRSTVRLLQECASAFDERGNPHVLVVLSNWDCESFTLLMQQYPEIFENFDEIFISGDIGIAKPHFACFNYVKKLLIEHNLDPNECYLIDDQKNNIEAAQKCGLKTILVQDKRLLRQQLISAGIL